ncbi:MAG TPA: histidinol-phosphate transaminase [Gaiellaceae bacterium]|nr:histidinol-phosphate transaminase [Gaiellaceae bacterium]
MPERAEVEESFFRRSLADLVPYEPGKPVEEVQRELGLDRVVKLASNEGSFGPFPAARLALERSVDELNRYPDGGAYRLRAALAERHDVRFEEIALGAGADGVVDCLSQAVLDPGDAVVCGWPSFPSYVIDAIKVGAEVRRVPLREDRYDLDGLLAAVDERTKLVYVCHPNNPTGTMNTRGELDAYFEAVPDHVLTVLDQAYLEYVDDPEYPNGIEEYFKAGRRVLVLRTFSKIYGLAGLRIGYGVGPVSVAAAVAKVRRAFDLSAAAQAAALASLDDGAELARRARVNREGRGVLERTLRDHGLDPAGPAVANFLYADVGGDARILFDELLRLGVIVRPLAGFGAPTAIRVTVGTTEENEFFAEALARLRDRVGTAS